MGLGTKTAGDGKLLWMKPQWPLSLREVAPSVSSIASRGTPVGRLGPRGEDAKLKADRRQQNG